MTYRPRQPTRAELEKQAEDLLAKRERFLKRQKKDSNEFASRSSRLNYSSLSGVAFRDYTLGPSSNLKSRGHLDQQAYLARRARLAAASSSSSFSSSQKEDEADLDLTLSSDSDDDDDTPRQTARPPFPRLSALCISVVVTSYGEPGVFDRLSEAHHASHVPALLSRLEAELVKDDEGAEGRELPYQVWLDFAYRFPATLPSKQRTYKGLVVSDTAELDVLKDLNAEAVQLFAQHSPSDLVPPFFLSFLDLSGELGFGDKDVFRLKPIASFLAVLRLDGTSVGDDGLGWIARAATGGGEEEGGGEAYSRLEVLSLKGLQGVTDEGVGRLAKLNLRMIDLRNTRCSSLIRKKLNASLLDLGSSTSFREARNWTSLPSPSIELQLFDSSNFTPSRVVSVLHYLAGYFNAPALLRPAALASPFVKPVAVSLSAMTRRAATSSSSSATPKVERTAEELYHDTLALKAGTTHAAHHRAFGAVTSTMALSRKAVDEDGHAESDKGAAFLARRDDVAAGLFIGTEGQAGGGRASLWDIGMRKHHVQDPKRDRNGVRTEREPFSDSEDEDAKDAEDAKQLKEAVEAWDQNALSRHSFYAGSRPTALPAREFKVPEESPMMLVRHLPYRPPYETRGECLRVVMRRETVEEEERERAVRAGGTLVKKRKAEGERGSGGGFFSTQSTATPSSSSSSSPATPQPAPVPAARPRLPPSLSSSSLFSASSASATPPPPPPSAGNPFAKKRTVLATPRHAAKNVVKVAPTLTKRSGLTAFQKKR